MAVPAPSRSSASGLTPKQQAFVREYLMDLNATAAYKRAGYKGTKAALENNASRMMGNDRVRAAIQAALAKIAERSAATVERLDKELGRIALADIRKLFRADGSLKNPDEWSDADAAAVASLECHEEFRGKGAARKLSGYLKKVKCSDKLAAIVELLKRRDAAGNAPLGSKDNPIHHAEVIRLVDPAPPSLEQALARAGISVLQSQKAAP